MKSSFLKELLEYINEDDFNDNIFIRKKIIN